MAVSTAFHKLAHEHMLRNWFEHYADAAGRGHRALLRVRVRRRDGHRLHRPHRPRRAGRQRHHRLQDRQERQRRSRRARACSSASTTWPCRSPRRSPSSSRCDRSSWRSCGATGAPRDRLPQVADPRGRAGGLAGARCASGSSALIARKRELNEREDFRPNPYANCRFCDFQTLCPLFPEGQPVFPVGVAAPASRGGPA